MLNRITHRTWNLIVVLCCASLVGFALYSQYVDYLEPCPLCIFQRVVFFAMAVIGLLAAMHNPGRVGQQVYTWSFVACAATGAAIAARHIWLQGLPPDQVPECGPGLNYMLENFPMSDVLQELMHGSGECAAKGWTFLSLGIPEWSLIWYVLLGAWAVMIAFRKTA